MLSRRPLPTETAAASTPTCDFPLKLGVGDECRAKWRDLQPHLVPTQQAVGYAWVYKKIQNDFDSKKHAQSAMDDSELPVALGPDGRIIYLLDHHHTLSALDYSGHSTVDVKLYVSCDFSALSAAAAWQALVSRALAYPYGRRAGAPDELPSLFNESALPARLVFRPHGNTTFADDRWRALSSFARKVKSLKEDDDESDDSSCSKKEGKYCMRAYIRACEPKTGRSTPFFEFRWAYFMNDAFLRASVLWDNQTASARFQSRYAALTDVTDVDAWQAAAVDLVYLCRGLSATSYALPSPMGAMAGTLPGVVTGLAPIKGDDPDCALPSCGT